MAAKSGSLIYEAVGQSGRISQGRWLLESACANGNMGLLLISTEKNQGSTRLRLCTCNWLLISHHFFSPRRSISPSMALQLWAELKQGCLVRN